MSYISTHPREQLMLPSSIDEYVSENNIVRFIDAFVDKVSKEQLVQFAPAGTSSTGRPCYPPHSLCKLLIYGYLNSVSSSRKLETETLRNMEVMWLLNNLHPDHWTISNFRKDNKEAIKWVTLEFRRFLRDSGYLSAKSISTDGTKVKAYASRDTLSIKLIDKKLANLENQIERYLEQLSRNDTGENDDSEPLLSNEALQKAIIALQGDTEELKSLKQLIESLSRTSIAPADLEARVMKTKDGFLPAYNVQTTVDNTNHFITSCEVTDNPNDFHLLQSNIHTLQEQLGVLPEEVLADAGYANEEQIQQLEEQGIDCIVAFPGESKKTKEQRDNGIIFTYDQQVDCYTCPQGHQLRLVTKHCKKKSHYYNHYQTKDCDGCPQRAQCTQSKYGRTVFRRQDGQWIENYRQRQHTTPFKERFKQRKNVVEHPFGTIKYLMGQIPLFLRSRAKVQIELDLYSTAYNLKRLMHLATVPDLLEQLTLWQPAIK
jgi:transposase